MSQKMTFCVVCALLRLNDGEHPGLVLAGLPRNNKRLGDPVCSHHLCGLNFKPIEAPVVRDGFPQYHFNGMPVVEMIGLEQRDIFDQINLIGLVRGDPDPDPKKQEPEQTTTEPKSFIPGMLRMLQHRLRLWQWQQWELDHIEEQPTMVLTPEAIAAAEAEEAANEEMFRRIGGYLALRAAGLDIEPVMIDDDSDRISGEE